MHHHLLYVDIQNSMREMAEHVEHKLMDHGDTEELPKTRRTLLVERSVQVMEEMHAVSSSLMVVALTLAAPPSGRFFFCCCNHFKLLRRTLP